MAAEVSPTAVAWNWIIETLAEVKDLNFQIFVDMISTIPGILKGTSAGDAARERVALRFLEECTGYVEDNATVSSLDVERIDVSESCHDVFCRFLQKDLHGIVILDDLAKMNGIRNFIIQKRAALPKLSLIMLKEAEDGRECTPVGGNEIVQRDVQNIVLEAEDARECTLVGGSLSVQRDVQNIVSEAEDARECALVGGNEFVQRDEQNIVSTSHESEHRDVMKAAKDTPKDSPVTILNGAVLQNNSSEHKQNLVETALVGHEDLFSGNGNDAYPESQAGASKSSEHNTDEHVDEYTNEIKSSLLSSDIKVPCCDGRGKVSDAPSVEDGFLDEQLTVDAHKKILLAEKLKASHIQLCEDGTENYLCFKCDEAGQLLSCVQDDCPINIHESCLGSSNTCFDDKGEFRCPFCSYIQAATSYYHAKKKVTIAREALESFMSFNPIKRSLQEPISSKNPGSLEKLDGKSHNDKDFLNIDRNTSGHAIVDVQCIDVQEETLHQRLGAINSGGLHDASSADNNNSLTGGESNIDGQCIGCERSHPVENNIADNSLDKDDDKKSPKTDNQKYAIDSQCQVQEQVATSCSDHATLEELQSEEVATRKRKKEVRTSKEGKSSKHKASKSYAKRYSNSLYPFARRSKLPWTMEEEEALKEAVQKFHQSREGVFPWTKILEHGRALFHRTRQPMDLKDKWRNIQKREERALGK